MGTLDPTVLHSGVDCSLLPFAKNTFWRPDPTRDFSSRRKCWFPVQNWTKKAFFAAFGRNLSHTLFRSSKRGHLILSKSHFDIFLYEVTAGGTVYSFGTPHHDLKGHFLGSDGFLRKANHGGTAPFCGSKLGLLNMCRVVLYRIVVYCFFASSPAPQKLFGGPNRPQLLKSLKTLVSRAKQDKVSRFR